MDATIIDCLLKLQVSKCLNFFLFPGLEVMFSCEHGSSATKIKTADIERIMCATVIEINLQNITMYQKERLFLFHFIVQIFFF